VKVRSIDYQSAPPATPVTSRSSITAVVAVSVGVGLFAVLGPASTVRTVTVVFALIGGLGLVVNAFALTRAMRQRRSWRTTLAIGLCAAFCAATTLAGPVVVRWSSPFYARAIPNRVRCLPGLAPRYSYGPDEEMRRAGFGSDVVRVIRRARIRDDDPDRRVADYAYRIEMSPGTTQPLLDWIAGEDSVLDLAVAPSDSARPPMFCAVWRADGRVFAAVGSSREHVDWRTLDRWRSERDGATYDQYATHIDDVPAALHVSVRYPEGDGWVTATFARHPFNHASVLVAEVREEQPTVDAVPSSKG
jgi:hypothetical protein